MKDLMLAWGKGTRACAGKLMATMELKLTTSAIVRQYDVRLASKKTIEDMEMTDHFTIIPKGKSCLLVFESCEN